MNQPETTLTESSSASKTPWIISGSFIGLLLACYFLWPAFQEAIQEAWQVLTSNDQKRISRWVSQFGFWGPMFIVLFMVAQMFLVVINVVALMVVAVLAYGPIWGSVISIAGIFVASTVGYLLGLGLGPATIGKFLGAKTQAKVAEQVDRYGIWAVVLARISPVISNDAISIVAGIVKMPYSKFMLATAGGIIPLTILIAYLGQNINRLKIGLIVVSIVGVVALVAYYIIDRRKQKTK
ncbi:TVP38/TMEM64 family protein [Adhaeribacter radiodurans]|uniref:TVP38/TMEM64 family membrane protein n=1 Tax=Adhaeribacter radiodurans TaxID=2745197 RepID=A0A7L7LFE5_9BACT|nr:VTT domain-containing protein [Adhaeribacter radiodurans]QMU31099.1 TVP38/TMEM64 family protein [Adhaeribacter radiodurans]